MTGPRPPGSFVATLDQMRSTLLEMAPMYGVYYRALRRAGLPRFAAAQLIRDHHRVVVCGVVEEDAEPDVDRDDDVVSDLSYFVGGEEKPVVLYHRGRDSDGCPVCGVLAGEPCVIRGRR